VMTAQMGELEVASGFEVISPEPSNESFDLSLPVTRSDFADFLGRVIGGKDKLEYTFRGDIHITAVLISGIESALVERVESQNGGRLVSSRYNVRFTNGRGFKTSKLESLLALSPRGEASTEFLSVELIFLINYPGVATPVREKVSLAFAAATASSQDSILSKRGVYDRARCEIEYHSRVFAEDCLNSINAIIDEQPAAPEEVSYVKRYSSFFGSTLPITTFFIVGAAYSFAVYMFGGSIFDLSKLTASPLTLDQKLDILIERSAPYMVAVYTSLFMLIGILFSMIPAVMVDNLLPHQEPARVSFGIFETDIAHMSRLARKKSKRLSRAALSILFSVVMSIAGAYLYDRLMGRV